MLSWNEIRHRAIAFSRDWEGTTSEKSERQTFWNEFFDIFGIKRRTVAAFEEPVRKLSGNWAAAVKQHRLNSSREATRKLATSPAEFGENRQPSLSYLLIPGVSSENRPYVPLGFIRPHVVASNLVNIVPGASLYHFGILASAMHMAWMATVTGRLESRFRYSAKVVYNNFPWPTDATEAQRLKVEECAQAVLAAREQVPGSTLADLYDPISMPPVLAKAHADLDRAVDRCYRKEAFLTDRQRVEYLFAVYETLTAPLGMSVKKPPTSKF